MAMLILWTGVGVIVHAMELEPVLAYVVGSFTGLAAPLIGLAFTRTNS